MSDFMQKIFDSKGPIVVDCWATWCGPCKAVAPVYEKLSESFPQVKFYKVDVDEQAEIAQELNVNAMPTYVFFKDGQKFSQVVGGDMKAVEKNLNDLVA
ncbi:thioredoxin trx1 [Penicillium sp. IBT 18751x]|nr:thioredoxin trx1 [Penicillium sp. IBT 18751x]